jgi:NTP pyrophosphatase (non-canonical NTP hydrolase)
MSEIKTLTAEIVSFIQERDWEQFHHPKDTALALSIEASELNEAFLWKREDEVDINKIKEELADVLIYSLDLARQYNLDVGQIIRTKIQKNREKYPVVKCKGSSKKYTEL